MDGQSPQEKAVELLQQLGLKEYEAKCFVALSRMPKGTAKEVSEISDVPRTRVYDAVRVLETKGLVDVQHSNPQEFRATSIEEAARTLRTEFESRTAQLEETLRNIEKVDETQTPEATHEVWALSGATAIANRTRQLAENAGEQVVLLVGKDAILTTELITALKAATDREVDLVIGTVNEQLQQRITDALPDATVFVAGPDLFHSWPPFETDATELSHLMLIDRESALVSSEPSEQTGEVERQAVCGHGFDNGFVAIVRRLVSTDLVAHEALEEP
jgi:sugar-specific transcriptional regulator TrmB